VGAHEAAKSLENTLADEASASLKDPVELPFLDLIGELDFLLMRDCPMRGRQNNELDQPDNRNLFLDRLSE
jgi:hypothetical protein